jgi:hypothetical protein
LVIEGWATIKDVFTQELNLMQAYKDNAVVTEHGLAILDGLPLPIGASVEVIVLDNGVDGQIIADVSDKKSADPANLEYLDSVSSLMTEWGSAADEFAYQDL